jgi:hypothetical protein
MGFKEQLLEERILADMQDRLMRLFWELPVGGYAENGKTAYPKQWFKYFNI